MSTEKSKITNHIIIFRSAHIDRGKESAGDRVTMAGMKRFVIYIYAYEEGQRAGNTGFAKLELRGEDCRMEIHLRGIPVRKAVCRVHFMRIHGEMMEGVPVGELQLINGSGDFYGSWKAGHMGDSPLAFSDLDGIF